MILHASRVLAVAGLELVDITCHPGATWSPPAVEDADAVCLVRSGWFRRSSRGRRELVDATGGFIARVGDEERVAGTAARLTWIQLSPGASDSLLTGFGRDGAWLLRTNSTVDLRHRALLAAARHGLDPCEATERLFVLLDGLPRQAAPPPSRPGPQARARHRSVTATAQEALNHDPALPLPSLASLADTSPHHLSRVFRSVTGHTVTRYRNELRVRMVLDRLADGELNLSCLAADLGFVDHAHMTRTVRQLLGATPSALRRLLNTA